MDQKRNPKKRRSYGYGKWIYKKTTSRILVCKCGAKYLKTRDKQNACVKCFTKV